MGSNFLWKIQWSWLATSWTWVNSEPLFQWHLTTYLSALGRAQPAGKVKQFLSCVAVLRLHLKYCFSLRIPDTEDWQSGVSLNRRLLRWWRGRGNAWNKERLRKLDVLVKEGWDHRFAAFSCFTSCVEKSACLLRSAKWNTDSQWSKTVIMEIPDVCIHSQGRQSNTRTGSPERLDNL